MRINSQDRGIGLRDGGQWKMNNSTLKDPAYPTTDREVPMTGAPLGTNAVPTAQ
jgi:hypothetical protein